MRLIMHHVMKAHAGVLTRSSVHSKPLHRMEVSEKLYILAALCTTEGLAVQPEHQAGWNPAWV